MSGWMRMWRALRGPGWLEAPRVVVTRRLIVETWCDGPVSSDALDRLADAVMAEVTGGTVSVPEAGLRKVRLVVRRPSEIAEIARVAGAALGVGRQCEGLAFPGARYALVPNLEPGIVAHELAHCYGADEATARRIERRADR